MKLAGKPGSVVDSHSSGPHITARLKPPTRKLGGTRQRLPIRCCSGWRLPRFTPQVGPGSAHVAALTTHRPADSSLWPCSSPHGGRALPVTLPCGARTFLYAWHGQVAPSGLFHTQRLPGQLRRGFYHWDTHRPRFSSGAPRPLHLAHLSTPAAHAPPPANGEDDDHAPPAHRDVAACSPDNPRWAHAHRSSPR